jgi:hypothetical protein
MCFINVTEEFLKKQIVFISLFGSVLFLSSCAAWAEIPSATQEPRQNIVDRKLNCVSNRLRAGHDTGWSDVCYTNDEAAPDELKKNDTINKALDEIIGQEAAPTPLSEPAELPAPAAVSPRRSMAVTLDENNQVTVTKDTPEIREPEVSEPAEFKTESISDKTGSISAGAAKKPVSIYEPPVFREDMIISKTSKGETLAEHNDKGQAMTEKDVKIKSTSTNFFYDFFDVTSPLTKIEFGTDSYGYRYAEPNLNVHDTGYFYGLFSSYTHRIRENQQIASWKDLFGKGNTINMFRLEGRFGYGYVDYSGSGTWDNIRDYVVEGRILAGQDIPVSDSALFTPYVGYGYRYLNDNFSSVPDRVLDGQNYYSGYDRESSYSYVPLGVESRFLLPSQWSLGLTLEYDFFIGGKQVSHLEDQQFGGVYPGYDPLTNDQEDGMGMRASFRIQKDSGRFSLFVEPFVRYWHIKDSKIEFVTINGQLVPAGGGLYEAGQEPDNNTTEYGIKAGARF